MNIHSIETFGTVDGPGIRYVIFVQGCLLRCSYCHNRDTWDLKQGSIRDIDSLVEEIGRYIPYLLPSGGGVTVSGGEPLLQAKSVATLFQKLKKENIPTALDTAGSIPITEDIKELLSYTDLVLLDMKHINDQKCIALTGKSNQNTMQFANYLKEQKISMWIRQVLIPGITDNQEDLLALKDFISSYDNIGKVELLPYHDMGKFKWEKLGFSYPLEGIPPATEEDVKKAKEILGI